MSGLQGIPRMFKPVCVPVCLSILAALLASCSSDSPPTAIDKTRALHSVDQVNPLDPQLLQAEAVDEGIQLNWQPMEVTPGYDYRYCIYRSEETTNSFETPTGEFNVQALKRLQQMGLVNLTSVPIADTSYLDRTADKDHTYYYRVRLVKYDDTGLEFMNHWSNEASGQWTGPQTPPILISSARTGNGDIYATDPTGSRWVRLTDDEAPEANALWSPDGTKILFSRRTNPDGLELWVMDADGGNQRYVTSQPNYSSVGGWWPTGDRIVYTRYRQLCESWGAFTNNLLGTDERSLFAPNLGDPGDRDIYGITIDPHGAWLAWAAQDGCWSPTLEIYRVNLAGDSIDPATVVRLTHDSAYDDVGDIGAQTGRLVYWHSFAGNGYDSTYWDIMSMDSSGGNVMRLTNNGYYDSRPVLSPDEQTILYSSRATGDLEVWAMDSDGQNKREFTDSPGNDVVWDWRN